MRIRWENIIGLTILVFVVVAMIKLYSYLEDFFNGLRFRAYTPYGRLWAFNYLGLICLAVIAIVKILSRR